MSSNEEKNPKPYGELWTIAENWTDHGISEIKDIENETALFLDPMQIEGSVRGNNLYEFLKEKNTPVLNATVWEYLRDNESQIPEDWKFSSKNSAQYVFFWGTIDRSPDGNLYVRYITWSGGNWVFSNYLMSGNWHEDFPAVIKKDSN